MICRPHHEDGQTWLPRTRNYEWSCRKIWLSRHSKILWTTGYYDGASNYKSQQPTPKAFDKFEGITMAWGGLTVLLYAKWKANRKTI